MNQLPIEPQRPPSLLDDVGIGAGTYRCQSTGYSRTKSEFEIRVGNFIAESNNLNHNLSSVISGINHEVSPWLGGALNTLSRLKRDLIRDFSKELSTAQDRPVYGKVLGKIDAVMEALNQASNIMKTISQNIKRLKQHAVEKAVLYDTVRSWFSIVFVSDTIKGALEDHQIEVDAKSLQFATLHSPMLLTQVFLNLVKNSIDHNPHMLDTLRIKVYGHNGCLIIEDNGKGVSPEILRTLFVPEVTTKNDGDIHGLGLYLCREYCHTMGAEITAENAPSSGLKLRIAFPLRLS